MLMHWRHTVKGFFLMVADQNSHKPANNMVENKSVQSWFFKQRHSTHLPPVIQKVIRHHTKHTQTFCSRAWQPGSAFSQLERHLRVGHREVGGTGTYFLPSAWKGGMKERWKGECLPSPLSWRCIPFCCSAPPQQPTWDHRHHSDHTHTHTHTDTHTQIDEDTHAHHRQRRSIRNE